MLMAACQVRMSPKDAVKMCLKDGDDVDVNFRDKERSVSLANTLICMQPGFATEMHLDTDEANAARIAFQTQGARVINTAHRKADILAKNNTYLNNTYLNSRNFA